MNPRSTEKPVASDAEHARGPVTVGEVAALRSAPAHQQHRRDSEGRDDEQDDERQDEVHGRFPA